MGHREATRDSFWRRSKGWNNQKHRQAWAMLKSVGHMSYLLRLYCRFFAHISKLQAQHLSLLFNGFRNSESWIWTTEKCYQMSCDRLRMGTGWPIGIQGAANRAAQVLVFASRGRQLRAGNLCVNNTELLLKKIFLGKQAIDLVS